MKTNGSHGERNDWNDSRGVKTSYRGRRLFSDVPDFVPVVPGALHGDVLGGERETAPREEGGCRDVTSLYSG